VLLVVAVCGALTWTLSGFGTATITTDQKLYSVGEDIVISGSGFSPNAPLTGARPEGGFYLGNNTSTVRSSSCRCLLSDRIGPG
jgi:hypothetical protein